MLLDRMYSSTERQKYLDIIVYGCPDNWKALFLPLASK